MSTVLRKLGVEVDLSGDGNEELRAWIKNLHDARGQGISMAGGLNQLEREMVEAAQKIGLSRAQLKELTAHASKSREIKEFADRYGVSMSQIEQQTRQARETVGKFGAAIQAVAAAGIGARLFGAGREMIQAAIQSEGAFAGLSAVVRSNFGAEAVPAAIAAVRQLKANMNGMLSETDIADAMKALASMGYSASDAARLVEANARAHMVAGNQTYSAGEAVRVYAKALKDGNSATIDVTGNSANLDQIMRSLGFSMSDLSDPVRGNAARLAYMNYQLRWAGMYSGEASRMMSGFTGQVSQLGSITQGAKIRIGGLLKDTLTPLLENAVVPLFKVLSSGLEWIFKHQGAVVVLKSVLMLLIPVIGVLLVGAMYSAAVAAWSMAAGVIAATWPFMLIAAAIMAVIIVVQDLYVWFTGGQSLIGSWLGPWRESINKIKGLFIGLWSGIKSVVSGILNFFKTNGRYIIMALFPVSILYFYWDQISGFLRSVPGRIMDFFRSIPDRILSALSGLKDRMKSYLSELLPAWAVRLVARVTGSGEQREAVEARASGGPVRVGREYLVGERGPERFIPDSSGTIIPNGGGDPSPSAGRGITFAPVITITGVSDNDGRSIAESVERALRDMMPSFLASLGLEVS